MFSKSILESIACTKEVNVEEIYINDYYDSLALAIEEYLYTEDKIRELEDLR